MSCKILIKMKIPEEFTTLAPSSEKTFFRMTTRKLLAKHYLVKTVDL